MQESREWECLIRECVPIEDDLVKVGILDSGVNHHHPLLSPFLPEDRCHSVLADTNLRDRANHGTGMAGLVLYGDLTNVIYDRNIKPVTNELVSVNTSHDTEETFIHRVANTAAEGEDVLSDDTNRWRIGINRRNQGSIHSDFICETAAQIASYDKIAIYPVTGWWKTRKSMLDKGVKYSLVVSLETPDIDIYTPISQIIRNTVEILNN